MRLLQFIGIAVLLSISSRLGSTPTIRPAHMLMRITDGNEVRIVDQQRPWLHVKHTRVHVPATVPGTKFFLGKSSTPQFKYVIRRTVLGVLTPYMHRDRIPHVHREVRGTIVPAGCRCTTYGSTIYKCLNIVSRRSCSSPDENRFKFAYVGTVTYSK